MKITEETTLAEICKYSQAEKILIKYRLPCLHCPLAAMEMGQLKIGQICQKYNIDLKNLLEELNKNIS